MTIKQMQTFAAVCSEGTLLKAAEKLYIAQSAVSRTIREISEQNNLKLFDRVGRKLRPTEIALQLLDDVVKVLDEYNRLEQKLANGGYTSSLNIGCSMPMGTLIMPKAIALFESKYPQTKLYIFENHTAEIEQKLISGELDFGVIAGSTHNPKLVEEYFDEEEFCWVCSADHPIAGEGEVSLARLAEVKMYLPGRDAGSLEPLEQYALEQGVELKPMWTTINIVATLNAVLSGKYIALMSENLVSEYVDTGKLKIIPTAMKITRKLGSVYLSRKSLSQEARAFIDICSSVSKQMTQKSGYQQTYPVP